MWHHRFNCERCESLLLSWWKLVDVNDVRTGFHIRDLIGMRDSSLKSVLNYNECTDIIVDLCTS